MYKGTQTTLTANLSEKKKKIRPEDIGMTYSKFRK